MPNKIKVRDIYNLVPGLFLMPGFEKVEFDYKVEILPTSVVESCEASDMLTVFIDSEPDIHNAHIHFAQQKKCKPNSIWAVSSISPTLEYQFDCVVEYHSNLIFTSINNSQCKAFELTSKPWLANVLLGGYMPKRKIIFDLLHKNKLDSQCLINFQPRRGQHHILTGYRTPALNDLDSLEWQNVVNEVSGFFSMIPVNNTPNMPGWISQKISYPVYNNTWLSVVAETENLAWPDTFLPSEKIAKPLLLGHPFLVYGCQHYLQQLRRIGFHTFDRWINEDYDSIEYIEPRISAMIDSLQSFAQLSDNDKFRLLTEMKPILDHNRRLMMDMITLTNPLADKIAQQLANSQYQ